MFDWIRYILAKIRWLVKRPEPSPNSTIEANPFLKPIHYILNDRAPIVEPDLLKWSRWMKFSLDQRRVAYDIVDIGLEVSTVFLGMDHNPFGDVPVLFETLIIGEDYDGYTARYTTWEEAEAGHKDVVNMLLGIKTA